MGCDEANQTFGGSWNNNRTYRKIANEIALVAFGKRVCGMRMCHAIPCYAVPIDSPVIIAWNGEEASKIPSCSCSRENTNKMEKSHHFTINIGLKTSCCSFFFLELKSAFWLAYEKKSHMRKRRKKHDKKTCEENKQQTHESISIFLLFIRI